MSKLPRIRIALGLAVALASLASVGPAEAQDEKKSTSDPAEFRTADGVLIKGAMYPAQPAKPKDRKKAVVILLHHFDKDKGGSSKKSGGWDELATALQQDGFPVLSFDFRGFGDSTGVDKDKFWNTKKNPHNGPGGGLSKKLLAKVAKSGKTSSISYKDFTTRYYENLLSDVAAARAYLDRLADANPKEMHTASIIVIGAGDGAAVGAAWMYNESRRRKDTTPPPVVAGFEPAYPRTLDASPESKDLAAGVFLSLSPSIGGRKVSSELMGKWTYAVGKRQAIPLAFHHGKGKDQTGDLVRKKYLLDIKPSGARGKDGKKEKDDDLKLTGMKTYDTQLVGEGLLDKDLAIPAIRSYLKDVMDERGNKERTDKETGKLRFLYTGTGKEKDAPLVYRGAVRVSKPFGQDSPFVDTDVVFDRLK
ncbi:MAG: hypothetical protein K2W96_14530 [Gemmataceae bacterium]|nr:hypothetical protein [Gemmataceae bacterium]